MSVPRPPSTEEKKYVAMLPSWPIERVRNLIPSPRSDAEHIHNLVLIAAGADLLLEYEYRRHHPEVSHSHFVGMINSPEFLDGLRRETAAQIGVSGYVDVMRSMLDKAKQGSVKAAEFLLAELGVSLRLKDAGTAVMPVNQSISSMVDSMTSAMVRVMDEKRQKSEEKIINTEAEIK